MSSESPTPTTRPPGAALPPAPRLGVRERLARIGVALALAAVALALRHGAPGASARAPQARAARKGRIVAFVIDSVANFIPPDEVPLFTSIRAASHGEAVTSVVHHHGSADKVELVNVDTPAGRIAPRRYLAALRAVAEHMDAHPQDRVVVNFSMGHPQPTPREEQLIRRLLDKGAVLVAAVGNDRSESVLYPAAYPGVIAVAATEDWEKAPYSNFGKRVDIAANGNCMHLIQVSGQWTRVRLQGTSFAAPKVAGAVTRILRFAGDRDVDVRAVLTRSATPMSCPFFRAGKLGAGLLSEHGALRQVDPAFLLGPMGRGLWGWLTSPLTAGAAAVLGLAALVARLQAKRASADGAAASSGCAVLAVGIVGLLVGGLLLAAERCEFPQLLSIALWMRPAFTWPPVLFLAALVVVVAVTVWSGNEVAHGASVLLAGLYGRLGHVRGLAREVMLCASGPPRRGHKMAYQRLVACGKPAFPLVARLLTDFHNARLHEAVRPALVAADARFGLTDELLGIATQRRGDDSVVEQPLRFLSPGDEAARTRRADHLLAIATGARDEPFQVAAVRALAIASPQGAGTQARLASHLAALAAEEARGPRLRLAALDAAGSLCPARARADVAPILLHIASDAQDPTVQAAAVAALPTLLERADARVRADTTVALAGLAASDAQEVALRQRALDAAVSLCPERPQPRAELLRALLRLAFSPHGALREGALETLLALVPKMRDPATRDQAIQHLLEGAGDAARPAEVRADVLGLLPDLIAAAPSTERLGHALALHPLALRADEDPRVRQAAEEAAARLGLSSPFDA